MFGKPLTVETLPEQPLVAAEFLIREIANHRRAIENANKLAEEFRKEYQKRIDEWHATLIATEQAEIDRLEPLLRSIVERETEGSDKKSLKLASGQAGFRKSEPTYFFHGEKADATNRLFVAAIDAGGKSPFIKHKPVLDWLAMKKTLRITADGSVCTADGELIDGLTGQNNPDRFYVKGVVKGSDETSK